MPKRGYQSDINHYKRKIRRLEQKERRRIRVIESSDSDEHSDNESNHVDDTMHTTNTEEITPDLEDSEQRGNDEIPQQATTDTTQETNPIPELDPDILSALGEQIEDTPKLGAKIHDKLANLWMPILRKGLDKDAKEKIQKQVLIPENCPLLQAPKLNPEISAAVSDATRLRDKRVESVQQQLGLGITALNRGLTLLLDGDKDRIQAIKLLSESCRILCDLHFVETEARKKFVTPGLDKSFTNLLQEVDRDDTLFGSKLSEKIKASKVIEKQGLQIKKAAPVNKTFTASSAQPSTSRLRSQVNWTGPPRYTSSRGGRGGVRKTAPPGRRTTQTATAKPAAQAKQRAPQQQ